jgi:alkylation response protein AidB-like acyl-CoA dehydrogenase
MTVHRLAAAHQPDAESVTDVLGRARQLLGEIADGAAQREAERTMPYAEIRRLAEGRLTAVRVPRRYGGPGFSLRQLFQLIIDIAAADSNIAQALRAHFGFVDEVLGHPDEGHRAKWFARILAGDVVGVALTEVGAPTGTILTRLTRQGTQFRLNGRKYYTTGTLFSQWVNVTAQDGSGEEYQVLVPTDREGVTLLDDWDGFGQRMTASGTTAFNDVVVQPDEATWIDRKAPRRSPSLFQLYLAATQTGIVKNVLSDAVSYAKTKSRPIRHALASKSVDDPFIQRTVGELASRAYCAEQLVLATADIVEEATQTIDETRQEKVHEATLAIAKLQFYTIENAMQAAQIMLDVGGASATNRRYNFDRHWRNARTLASHNPRDYKAQVVGASLLTGKEPPRNFF